MDETGNKRHSRCLSPALFRTPAHPSPRLPAAAGQLRTQPGAPDNSRSEGTPGRGGKRGVEGVVRFIQTRGRGRSKAPQGHESPPPQGQAKAPRGSRPSPGSLKSPPRVTRKPPRSRGHSALVRDLTGTGTRPKVTARTVCVLPLWEGGATKTQIPVPRDRHDDDRKFDTGSGGTHLFSVGRIPDGHV